MLGTADKTAYIADLLVTVAAVAADPTGASAAGLAAKGWLTSRSVFTPTDPGTKALSKEVAGLLQTGLDTPDFHMPAKGRTLLPQMVEQRFLPSPRELVECGLKTDIILSRILDRHDDSEYKSAEMAEAFCNWLRPVFERLTSDPAFVQTLAPVINTRILTALDSLQAEVRGIPEQVVELLRKQGLVGGVSDGSVTLGDLVELAGKFEAHDLADAQKLVDFLTSKATEYRSYRKTIAGLDDRVAAIANLKGAAQDAAERLNFDEVETLLSRVDEMETKIAADTKLARAENALLRGRVDQAATLLTAAAESFASVDLLEVVRRRGTYATLLYEHGLRYGGDGLLRAIEMLEPVSGDDIRAKDAELWGKVQGALGNALGDQATRSPGAKGDTLFERAVAAYEDALTVWTRDGQPMDWARTQVNLGNALLTQAIRSPGAKGDTLLGRAVAAYDAALTVRSRDDQPMEWAGTQMNLGNALANQAIRTPGAKGDTLFERAVAAYDAALTVCTRDDQPMDWAQTQMNLGNALGDQATRSPGAKGGALFDRAVAAYDAALTVWTRDAHPMDWALVQQNMGIAAFHRAGHDSTSAPRAHLTAALRHAENALSVFDPVHTGAYYEKATRLRDAVQAALDDL